MLSVDEAWMKIGERAKPLPAETIPLSQAAGRVLAEPVQAPIDLPPFDNSAMDGYALRAADTLLAKAEEPTRLPVTGEVAAGDWRETPVDPGTAVKIMTGAPLPGGADTVLQLEAGRLRGNIVEIREALPAGRHVRRRGEDVRQGESILNAGQRINAQRIGLLANSGIAKVRVHRKLRVALLATGSELIPAGEPLAPGKIYDSNRIVLRTLIEATGSICADLGVAADDPKVIRERIQTGLKADMLAISGGVSVGAHDHVKPVLQELDIETLFWRVNMKPGKPLLCGGAGSTWVFGLPGNPISCVVGFMVFMEPLIRRLQGEQDAAPRYETARLAAPVRKKDERRFFMTARLTASEDGTLLATPTQKQGSAMMQALAESNALMVVPENQSTLAAGAFVQVLRFRE